MFAYIYSLIEVLVVLVPILLSVAFITVIERKVIAAIQRRVGPNMVGFYGVLQPFADALKLVVKETIIPNHANRVLLFLAPIVTLTFSLLGWAILPLGQGYALADLSLGILYSIALSSVGILGILFAGWSSNSKYAFMGGLRSTSQLISYELILTSVILIVIIITGTFSYTNIIEHQQSIWFVVPLFPLFIIWFFSALAETNRTPFDLPEAESELVSGFNTDYSGIIFVFFFLAEYSNIILISALTSIFFFGGFHFPVIFEQYSFINIQSIIIALKTCVFCFAFVWFRASLPRLRFDQLITACWLTLLPLVIGLMIFVPCVVMAFDCSPYPVLFQSSKSTKFMLIIGIISTVVWLAIVPFFSKTVSSVHYTRIAVMVFLLSLMLGTFLSLDTVELYHSLFSYSPISMMIDSLLLVIGILVLVCFSANSSSPSNGNINEVTLPKSEYSLILIFSILGASIMISANDLISMYVGLELQSFGLYILACLRTDLTGSTHASLKYFLLGAISSAFILLGISLIYQEVGSTIFQSIHSFVTVNTSHESLFILDQGHKLVALGLLSMLCGFIFKISAAPFHSWFSDVIQGVPTATGIVIINLPKISIFTFLFNMLLVCGVITSQTEGMAQDNFLSTTGETFLIITTLFSLIFGTVAGLMQTKMKRLLAFSTISHVGFIIIGVVVGSEVGLNAMIFYLVQYTLTVVLTFLCLVAYEASYIVENKDNAVNNIHELQGTGQYYKLLTFTFVLCLFSIAGIPPLTGFYAKLGVLNSSILQNISLVFLTAIVCSVISAAYYFKVIKVMMFDSVPSDQVKKEVLISPLHGYTMAVLTAFLCLFILDPRLIINCTELVALSLYMT